MKLCNKCNTAKDNSDFGSNKRNTDGLQRYCKKCLLDYRRNNKERFKNYDKQKYEKHSEKIKERQRQARANNPDKFADRDRAYRENNLQRLQQYDASRTRDFKQKIFSRYGDRCECCGESYFEFLTIDHIGGGGNTHRKEVGYGQRFYRWLKENDYPDGFRILCMNCNFSLGLKGYCPHKSGTKYKAVREDI